jgi:hypothetical protein
MKSTRDGSNNSGYKLLRLFTFVVFLKRKENNAIFFNRSKYCHFVFCLQIFFILKLCLSSIYTCDLLLRPRLLLAT